MKVNAEKISICINNFNLFRKKALRAFGDENLSIMWFDESHV